MRRLILISIIFILTLSISTCSASNAAEKKHRVLATTFPIYLITRNIIQSAPDIDLQLMLPAELGCPHDYALTPKDMRKIVAADIIVINGLGMEEFLGAPLKSTNKKIKVIDSSQGITTLEFTDSDHLEDGNHDHEAEEEHAHSETNPHLFVSPRLNGKIAENIAAGLGRLFPTDKELFSQNATAYKDSLIELTDKIEKFKKSNTNNRIIQPHGIFDYLAQDLNLEIMATLLPHGQKPAASQIISIIKLIKSQDIGTLLTEPQYSDKTAKMLAQETGIKVIKIDPTATGLEDAPLDYYKKTMLENIARLQNDMGK